jgi:hypothetical protein
VARPRKAGVSTQRAMPIRSESFAIGVVQTTHLERPLLARSTIGAEATGAEAAGAAGGGGAAGWGRASAGRPCAVSRSQRSSLIVTTARAASVDGDARDRAAGVAEGRGDPHGVTGEVPREGAGAEPAVLDVVILDVVSGDVPAAAAEGGRDRIEAHAAPGEPREMGDASLVGG